MATAAELRQLLKEDANGQNLYDHLTNTLMKILVERPKNAFEQFEVISADVKANPLAPEKQLARPLEMVPEQLAKQKEWMEKNAAQLKVPDEPPEEPSVKLCDLLDDSALYEWAGIGFGRSDLFRLQLAIKKFVETANLPSETERIRFVGRFHTRGEPYYVLEGLAAEDPENINERLQEGRSGSNKFVYYVSQFPEQGKWTKLPFVTQEQIVKSRLVRRLLTGNLDAPVAAYPPFPGQEQHYLRAILANLVHDTSVSPEGYFDLDSDSDPPVVKPAEPEAFNERFPKSAGDLKDVEAGWRHHETPLNAIGRVLPLPEVSEEDQAAGIENDPAGAEVSSPLESLKPELWTARVCPGGAAATSTSAVVLRSLKWPGAVAVAQGRKFVNIYVGNGLSAPAKPTGPGLFYSPPLPGAIAVEFLNAPNGEGALPKMVEQEDVRADPTPPQAENAEAEE